MSICLSTRKQVACAIFSFFSSFRKETNFALSLVVVLHFSCTCFNVEDSCPKNMLGQGPLTNSGGANY